jgi:hypothetical protein
MTFGPREGKQPALFFPPEASINDNHVAVAALGGGPKGHH